MTTILAIDPGCTESAYVAIDAATRRPVRFDKVPNGVLLDSLVRADIVEPPTLVAIEMVASYGMPVGREVFETCVWVGRFQQAVEGWWTGIDTKLVTRRPIKLHHCGSARAKDSNISQALIDRFASGQPNRGKGTKARPGWFYGFRADIWQAYALAVYTADTTTIPELLVSPPAAGTPAAAGAAQAQGVLL